MTAKNRLIEEVWRSSNLSWRQAERIITEAMDLGAGEAMLADRFAA